MDSAPEHNTLVAHALWPRPSGTATEWPRSRRPRIDLNHDHVSTCLLSLDTVKEMTIWRWWYGAIDYVIGSLCLLGLAQIPKKVKEKLKLSKADDQQYENFSRWQKLKVIFSTQIQNNSKYLNIILAFFHDLQNQFTTFIPHTFNKMWNILRPPYFLLGKKLMFLLHKEGPLDCAMRVWCSYALAQAHIWWYHDLIFYTNDDPDRGGGGGEVSLSSRDSKKIRQKFFGLAGPILQQFFFELQKEDSDCYLLFDEFLAFLIENGSHTQIF